MILIDVWKDTGPDSAGELVCSKVETMDAGLVLIKHFLEMGFHINTRILDNTEVSKEVH